MKAYLFDVDGVLSDPETKQVTEAQLFDELLYLLENGNPVCLNTGRSLAWVETRVIDPLFEKIADKTSLSHFMLVGEKGGTWMTFDENGERKRERDESITVPAFLKYEIRSLVSETFAKSMFFDESKETMISVEMQDNFDLTAYHSEQQRLIGVLEALLSKHELETTLKIDPTIIATDIENSHVGKALGADRFLQFLDKKNLKPDAFFAFGDSNSDIEMADELAKRGQQITFIFVGNKEKMQGVSRNYPLEFVSGFSKGTLEYLTK